MYFDQFTDYLTPNDLHILTIIFRKWFYKTWFLEISRTIFIISPEIWTFPFYFLFSFFNFAAVIMKERKFLRVADLSFDTRSAKYYQISLRYHEQWPINNIKVEYSQIGNNGSHFLWTCSLQIVPDKLRGFLIS